MVRRKTIPTLPSKHAILERIEKQTSRPARLKELMRALGVPKTKRTSFHELMDRLVEEGSVIEIKGNRYGIPNRMNLLTGTLSCHPDGFGFVIPEKEGEADVFIGRRNLVEALHGDRVIVRIESTRHDGKREGRIIRILDHGISEVVGRYEPGKEMGFIIPTDKRIGRDILVSKESSGEAAAGDLVVARITAYPTPYRNPEARVLRVIGKADDPKIDTEMVIAEFGLSKTFPPEVVSEADALPGKVPERDIKGRKDLRNLKTVTIDGESARDFDDAVSVQKVSGGRIRLWVHIADVGHYVAWDSPLDREARNRGTSVYFPDAVVPMLPERLSNGICSLNPKVDRLTLTAEMLFGPDGRRQDYSVYESVIRSDERMTYTAVKEIIEDRNPDACRRYQSLLDDFGLMEELARRLLDRRREDGSIDFDLPEPEIILDLQGRPTDILKGERYFSHRIIEEFMLAANRTVAEHLLALDVPLIFRTHEPPDPDVVKDFFSLVQSFGLAPPPKNSGGAPKKIHPKVFQGIIEKVRGREEERLVNQVLLRSMKQARYTMANAGHFGLAFDDYTHFTSPIRRYPDLVVHRILKETFKPRGMTRKRKDQLEHTLPDMARTSSERERTAMEAEREVVDLKKIRFLSDREGEEYFGHISGVTAFGFFVQLEGIFAEGLVHIGSIADDYYIYNDKRHCLTGRHKKKTFQLGNRVQIRIENVDLVRRQADFTLAGEKDSGGRRTAKRGKTPGKPKEATAGNSRNKTKTKGRRKRRRG